MVPTAFINVNINPCYGPIDGMVKWILPTNPCNEPRFNLEQFVCEPSVPDDMEHTPLLPNVRLKYIVECIIYVIIIVRDGPINDNG